MKNKSLAFNKSGQSGVTLIEVLISMFIISFAVVGAATLQIESLKNSLAMEHRAQATFLANDLLERIRATKPLDKMEDYAITISANPDDDGAEAGETVSQHCAVSNTANVIQDDLTEWGCLVNNTLPTGTAAVAVDRDNGFVTLNFGWVQRPAFFMGTSQNMNFVIEARI